MLTGFKKFLLRGNVVDMAVGIVIGAAFGTVVSSLVKDLLTPLIAAIVKKPDFSSLSFTFNNSKFLFGNFVNAVVSFVIIAAAVYFFVVLPVNALVAKVYPHEDVPPTTRPCPECLSDIPINAKRCKFCAQPVGAKTA
ncbi:MAG TPA: large conductance mechanosensitive channel protein MscL [Candidatus Acidoferrum sp.]|nr:large conductance mechanosensitive channel protein MscL [Candidatus Acidoferrum sp.]